MNIFNRIAGAFIGIVTGTLTVALQIPYAYYIVYRNMREAIRVDLFLMSTPDSEDHRVSDRNHLYLYREADGKVFYYIENGGKQYVEDQSQQALKAPKEVEFSSTKEKLVKCEDQGIIKLISDITSRKGHTQVAGYPLFISVLATATIGTFGAIITALGTVLMAPLNIALGARLGWNEGTTSAIAFPNRFRAMSNFLRDHLRPLRRGGIFNPGPTSFKIIDELTNLSKAGADHWNYYSAKKNEESRSKSKVEIVNKILALPTINISPDFPLSEEQVQKFSAAVAAQKELLMKNKEEADDPNYKKNVFLSGYLSSCCPITLAQLYEKELQETEIQTFSHPDADGTVTNSAKEPAHIENNKIPITVECLDNTGGKTVATYNYDAFATWLHTALDDKNIHDLLLPDRRRSLIYESNQIKIYRGYSKDLDVEYILEVIKKWEKENTIITDPTPAPEMETLYSDSKPPSQPKNPHAGNIEENARMALRREGLIAALEKQHSKSSTQGAPADPAHDKTVRQRNQS